LKQGAVHRKKAGFSLLEVVVALGILALLFPIMLNLVPSSRLATFRADLIQTATASALLWLEQARKNPVPRQADVVVNNITFKATTQIFPVPQEAMDDIVVTFIPPRGGAIVVATRIGLVVP
jgi:prepilin-type N-terminal cleavage/methylation domain-containing protein